MKQVIYTKDELIEVLSQLYKTQINVLKLKNLSSTERRGKPDEKALKAVEFIQKEQEENYALLTHRLKDQQRFRLKTEIIVCD